MGRSGGDADFEIPVPLVLGLLALPIGAFGSMLLHYSGDGPSLSAVAGCYAASSAPTLALDGRYIRFGQQGGAPIEYDFSLARLGGLAIAPREAVRLVRERSGYRFHPASRGTLSLFSLERSTNGQWRPVRRPAEMDAIAVLADDGRTLRFERVPPARCSPAVNGR